MVLPPQTMVDQERQHLKGKTYMTRVIPKSPSLSSLEWLQTNRSIPPLPGHRGGEGHQGDRQTLKSLKFFKGCVSPT